MKAIVLVGGFGTRLRPLTLATPKQMLPVLGVPMIERVVAWLARFDVTDAVLSLGYRPDAFFDAYPDDLCAGVRLHYAVEPEPLDTAGAVRFAATDAGIDKTFLVVNGDVLTDLDVTALCDLHATSGGEATIALTPVDDPSRYGVVPVDEDGRVTAFIEKPPADEAPSKWINAGTYVLEPSVIERIPAGRRVSIERETFPSIVGDGGLFAMQSETYWVDAGTPATYLQVQLDLVDGVRGPPEPAISASAQVHPSAVVDHAAILQGAVVDSDATVRDALIMCGARIGAGACIDGSIVGPGSVVGPGATLRGLTVTGDGAEVDAGAVLDAARVPDPD